MFGLLCWEVNLHGMLSSVRPAEYQAAAKKLIPCYDLTAVWMLRLDPAIGPKPS